MFFGLRSYQTDGVEFIRSNPKCGLFFDCGLGKTLTALASLQPDRLPALVIAPKRVARHVWPVEVEQWGFPYSVSVVRGAAATKKRRANAGCDLTVVNPESLSAVAGMPWRTVLVDESTYFKNHKSARWKHAKKLCDAAEYVVLMTGTPIAGRGHIDTWAQMALLGEHNPLGSWSSFTNQHFYFDHFNRPILRSGHEDIINEAIAPVVLRRGVEEIKMPLLLEQDIVVDMPAAAMGAYTEAQMEENSYAPLRTLASGFAYDKHWSGEVNAKWLHSEKLDALRDLVDDSGDRLLVFANFTAEIDAIADKFDAAVIDGRTSAGAAAVVIERWNNRELPMAVLHPRSAGHGLNLQRGGHRVVWFSLPDSGETYIQANGRLYRSGQSARSVFVHRMIAEGTIDETIAGLLKQKILNEQNLLAAVKASS